jgi:hypothetical protein
VHSMLQSGQPLPQQQPEVLTEGVDGVGGGDEVCEVAIGIRGGSLSVTLEAGLQQLPSIRCLSISSGVVFCGVMQMVLWGHAHWAAAICESLRSQGLSWWVGMWGQGGCRQEYRCPSNTEGGGGRGGGMDIKQDPGTRVTCAAQGDVGWGGGGKGGALLVV